MNRAKAAQAAGYDVIVLTHVDKHGALIEVAGFKVIPLTIDRRSLSPFDALATLRQLVQIYRSEKPALIHQVAIKPILLGTLAARIAGVRHVVNAIVGGGYIFNSNSALFRGIRALLHVAFRVMLNPPRSRVIFENQDDLNIFVESRQVRSKDAVLIRGAGVDVERFYRSPSRNNNPVIILPARLLWDKGVGEFIEATRMLKAQGSDARFVLVGGDDPGNRARVDPAVISQWQSEGVVEVWGFKSDMAKVMSEADVVCLPSYREGLPKALLEGMAAGLPCVTTDVPGCREAVTHGENGLLVPPKDHVSLAKALDQLIRDPSLRDRMGRCGRTRALEEFSSAIVCSQTLKVYEDLLSS